AKVTRKPTLIMANARGEFIKVPRATAIPESAPRTMPVRGRDMLTGLPKTIQLSSLEVYDAMAESIQAIVDTVQAALERTPPELIADIIDHGIVMAGGGALLPSLDVLLREETGLPATVAEEPLFCVVHGVSDVLDDIELLEKISV